MTDIPVASRIIKGIHFSPSDGRVMLSFANGQTRVFEGVPLEAITDMVEAPSPGQHYVERFRHQYQRVA
ncbi:KTSC domain-containing protein [Antarcticirhabdus aurantiaca]|uniref:KTSC domain-containing protein n=1 Tax=Antarcticirhabdus aurantiaca TaxID=2606717 RepID=A0ACD4NU50_9HYPH|nr:KTSC domain-containing protein [Antarcticirhabdus aurantiaca]WAJ30368.1 KTSC domain-containing protein [Jeongeuplla avenae]